MPQAYFCFGTVQMSSLQYGCKVFDQLAFASGDTVTVGCCGMGTQPGFVRALYCKLDLHQPECVYLYIVSIHDVYFDTLDCLLSPWQILKHHFVAIQVMLLLSTCAVSIFRPLPCFCLAALLHIHACIIDSVRCEYALCSVWKYL
jgi:hypothetical protein